MTVQDFFKYYNHATQRLKRTSCTFYCDCEIRIHVATKYELQTFEIK